MFSLRQSEGGGEWKLGWWCVFYVYEHCGVMGKREEKTLTFWVGTTFGLVLWRQAGTISRGDCTRRSSPMTRRWGDLGQIRSLVLFRVERWKDDPQQSNEFTSSLEME